MVNKITNGVDFNRYFSATISAITFGPDDQEADFDLLIRGPSIHFHIINTSANPVEYSFNGNTLHGRLAGNTERLYSFRRVPAIWFRAPSGNADVQVEAWATA